MKILRSPQIGASPDKIAPKAGAGIIGVALAKK